MQISNGREHDLQHDQVNFKPRPAILGELQVWFINFSHIESGYTEWTDMKTKKESRRFRVEVEGKQHLQDRYSIS